MSNAVVADAPTADLAGPLTIRQAAGTRDAIRAAFDKDGPVVLHVADDAETDLSFLQLVQAARLQADTFGRGIALAKPAGGSLLATLERAGFLTAASARDLEFWLHRKD